MQRRAMLKMLGASALAGCPFCAASAGAAEKGGSKWSYEGANGPETWGQNNPAFAACATGAQQSPVDLRNSVAAGLEEIEIFWRPLRLDILNNGHTIQVNAQPGGFMVLEGTRYDLLQFHFHHPSEHTVYGEQYPMEVHFVHKAADGKLGVLGAFIAEGAENATINTIWKNVAVAGGSSRVNQFIEPDTLLPDDRSYFRYAGSLTTPPCSEVVDWAVLTQPITASPGQIEAFANLYPMNARPIQSLNRRFVLGSF
jgi:carbonic anhydrase